MPTARKHHYIPKSFLAAWTDDGTVDGQLLVIDTSTGKSWPVKPVNAAKETDLYMIDASKALGDLPATTIETFFAKIEDGAAPIIKRMLMGEAMVSGAEREVVVTLLASLFIRVPSRLDWINDSLGGVIERITQTMAYSGKLTHLDNPELVARILQGGDHAPFKYGVTQNTRLSIMSFMLSRLFHLFNLRHWTVLRPMPDAGDLICTDHPVLLDWINEMPARMSPGFGLDNTAIIVPIGPAAALVGLWSAAPKDQALSREQVTLLNGQLLGSVHRFIFSRGDFAALHNSGAIHSREDFIRGLVQSS